MSIATDTVHAELVRELRADLASTRNALFRAQEALSAEKRQAERLRKAIKLVTTRAAQFALEMERVDREV